MEPAKKPGLKVILALFAKEKHPAWINGSAFELLAISQGKKGSNGSRRCRELADEGTFEHRMNGKSVEYRYLQKEVQKNPATNYKCSHSTCPKDALTYLEDKPVCLGHSKEKIVAPSLF